MQRKDNHPNEAKNRLASSTGPFADLSQEWKLETTRGTNEGGLATSVVEVAAVQKNTLYPLSKDTRSFFIGMKK